MRVLLAQLNAVYGLGTCLHEIFQGGPARWLVLMNPSDSNEKSNALIRGSDVMVMSAWFEWLLVVRLLVTWIVLENLFSGCIRPIRHTSVCGDRGFHLIERDWGDLNATQRHSCEALSVYRRRWPRGSPMGVSQTGGVVEVVAKVTDAASHVKFANRLRRPDDPGLTDLGSLRPYERVCDLKELLSDMRLLQRETRP